MVDFAFTCIRIIAQPAPSPHHQSEYLLATAEEGERYQCQQQPSRRNKFWWTGPVPRCEGQGTAPA
jgi:hypothetical protein